MHFIYLYLKRIKRIILLNQLSDMSPFDNSEKLDSETKYLSDFVQ